MTAPVQAQDGRRPPRAHRQAARSSRAPLGTDTASSAPRLRAATRGSDRSPATLSTPFRTLEARR
ncbi:hypothetical protein QE400_000514 [Xanthomonas sacchari]|nr:hypothetical protein [Xanthomonas sacchari]